MASLDVSNLNLSSLGKEFDELNNKLKS